ncbi:MAG TPA: alginate lyase family protein [Blastocatellia bacterium]|nr:alginate lyase family protein [Blastocatellia bacterium]
MSTTLPLNLSLLFRTLAPLRWEQFVYRPLRVAQFRAYRTFPSFAARWKEFTNQVTPAPFVATIRTVFENSFVHLHTESDWERLRNNQFTFLNHTLELPDIDWNRRYESHLWNYQFHYFHYTLGCARDFVRGDAAPMRHNQKLIERWIAQARIGQSDGWDAYPISLRVVNWMYAYALLADRYDDQAFLARWRTSLYQQLAFLHEHLEYHLLANHLLKNAKALVIGGLFFADDPRGQQWLAAGEQLLWREFEEQVLEDGGHYERSPMYHALCCADFLECFALLREFKTQRGIAWEGASASSIAAKLQAMVRFLRAMSYADGTLALFNDSGNSEEARPLPLLEAAARILGIDVQSYAPAFPETGYYLWLSPDEQERIIVDAGPPAVAYNLAHAHCDLLSYELRFDGEPFIVDSGVHGYGGDTFREYSRSTRAHNTVMFDGREQSEVWGTFRMGHTAELLDVETRSDEQTWEFRGAYRPFYDRSLTHERRIQRSSDGIWKIEDRVLSGNVEQAQSFIHLHPNVITKQNDDLSIECQIGSRRVLIRSLGAIGVEVIKGQQTPAQGWYFPDFGVAQSSFAICFTYPVKEAASFGYLICPL